MGGRDGRGEVGSSNSSSTLVLGEVQGLGGAFYDICV